MSTRSQDLNRWQADYAETAKKVVELEEMRDGGEPIQFRGAVELYDHLNFVKDVLRDFDELPPLGLPSTQVRTAIDNVLRLLLVTFAELQERVQAEEYNERLDAARKMRAFARDIMAWGFAAVLYSARIEGKLARSRTGGRINSDVRSPEAGRP